MRTQSIRLNGFPSPMIAALCVLVLACACSSKAPPEKSAAEQPKPPAPQLPPPYGALRIGMSLEELAAPFSAVRSVGACNVKLLGRAAVRAPKTPGSDKQANASCASDLAIGGMTDNELLALSTVLARNSGGDSAAFADLLNGALLISAQVRGTVRAGYLSDQEIYEAAGGGSLTAFDAVVRVTGSFLDGARRFARDTAGKYAIGATLDRENCESLDPEKIRRFVLGEFGRSGTVTEAEKSAARCGGRLLRRFGSLGNEMVSISGAIAGVGLARGMRGDRKVDPADERTYAYYRQRTGMRPRAAKVGVIIANALEQTEAYWNGAIELTGPKESSGPWGTAVVWLHGGRLARVLVNIADAEKLEGLPGLVTSSLGAAASTDGTITAWKLADGVQAVLDIGAAGSLVLSETATQHADAVRRP